MRHRVVHLIVDRGWPLFIGIYCALAAVSVVRYDDTPFHLYAYAGHPFGITVFTATAVTCLITAVVPHVRFHRWAFFLAAGFTMTGRILQHEDSGRYGIAALARGAFTIAALLAHLVIQVDWMIERDHDDR